MRVRSPINSFYGSAKWLKPELMIEIEAKEVIKKGHPRVPVQKRTDNRPKNVAFFSCN